MRRSSLCLCCPIHCRRGLLTRPVCSQAEFDETTELESAAEQRQRELRELATSPTLYDDLAHALAPSVWEMDDVKRGVLLMLFGGTHKQASAADRATDLAADCRLPTVPSIEAPNVPLITRAARRRVDGRLQAAR